MKAESRILSAIYATLLLMIASFGSGCTDAAEPSQASPRSPAAEAYLAAVQGMGLQTDITYSSGEKEVPELPDSRSGDNFSIGKTIGWALLAFMVLALAGSCLPLPQHVRRACWFKWGKSSVCDGRA